jgi:hypothetical protein
MNQIPRHIIVKSQPNMRSLILFSEFSAFVNSYTVFLVLCLDATMLPSILFMVSPCSMTISLSVWYILFIFARDVCTLLICSPRVLKNSS